MISLAHTLYLEVVAEGVGTPTQLARLRSLGCVAAEEGYRFGRPIRQIAATEILETVDSRR